MGLQGYSSPTEHTVIFSDSSNRFVAERVNTLIADMATMNADLPAKRVSGTYKGTIEEGWAVPRSLFDFLRNLIPAFCRDQESVLLLGTPQARNWRPASLWYLNQPLKAIEQLGTWMSVAKQVLREDEDYTTDGVHIWVCRKNPPTSQHDAEQRQIKAALVAAQRYVSNYRTADMLAKAIALMKNVPDE